MNPIDPRPAARQDDRSLAQLLSEAKAHDHVCEMRGREALDAAYRAGKALLAAKEKVGHGEWASTLEKHMPGRARTARAYMRIAEHWAEVKGAGSLREALLWLTNPVPDQDLEDGGEEEPQEQNGSNAAILKQPVLCSEDAPGVPALLPFPGLDSPARLQERLTAALMKLKAVQDEISEVYATEAGQLALKKAAATSQERAIHATDSQVEHGTQRAAGVTVTTGPRRVTNHALDHLLMMVAAAKITLARMAEE